MLCSSVSIGSPELEAQRQGFYGLYGGQFAPESLMPALEELYEAFRHYTRQKTWVAEWRTLMKHFGGRPTPLYHAKKLSEQVGFEVYLKREDLLHGGAHKTNNAVGQALLAKSMGKKRIIAETGAGQHGVATAMAGALLGLETVVYMGAVDVERQAPNVQRMALLGTTVVPVTSGAKTLKDAINEAMRDWITNVRDTHYILGTAAGPHPFPQMVRFFHQVIGEEARHQMLDQVGHLPTHVVACVGGGSNAIGIFSAFLQDTLTTLIGVEPAGHGTDTPYHGAVLGHGSVGVLHGMRSKVLQTVDGQILETHSVSAGLDYPSVGPEHAYLADQGRAIYESVTDVQAIEAFYSLSRLEGIIPALETSHALAYLNHLKGHHGCDAQSRVLLCLSGRGDKDLGLVQQWVKEHPEEALRLGL
ncbi:MAG: tryptophan synthase subunit beta [Vampirovibrionales bacterium]